MYQENKGRFNKGGNRGGGSFGGNRGGFGSSSGGDTIAPVKVGETLDVKIEAVGEKGDGIAKKNGFVIFVPGGKTGETVNIKITRVLKKMAFSEITGAATGGSSEDFEESSSESREASQEAPEESFEGEDSDSFGEEDQSEEEQGQEEKSE